MYIDKNDHNRNYFLNLQKDIVWTGNEYRLQKTYEEDKDGNIKKTLEHENNPNKNQYSKNCGRCIHCYGIDCTIRTALEKCPEHHFIPYYWTANCDAYSPVFPLNIIKSKNEMISFIDRVKNLFDCQEDYENYFGFKRRWDEETGEILESTMEYYQRDGKFEDIPDKYPCVIYFGVVDFDGERGRDEKLNWIYIGQYD